MHSAVKGGLLERPHLIDLLLASGVHVKPRALDGRTASSAAVQSYHWSIPLLQQLHAAGGDLKTEDSLALNHCSMQLLQAIQLY